MISLELNKEKKFEQKDKWPLLYLIADIFINVATEEKPITDVEAVNILKDEYGLEVERRSIKRYRDYLSDYFGFTLSTRKKGHYVKADFTDESLLNLALYLKSRPIKNKGVFFNQVTFKNGESTNDLVEEVLVHKEKNDGINVVHFKIVSKAIKENKVIEYSYKPSVTYNDDIKDVEFGLERVKIIPLKIFYYNKLYLLGFRQDYQKYYIVALENISISKKDVFDYENKKQLDFDLNKYLNTNPYLSDRFIEVDEQPISVCYHIPSDSDAKTINTIRELVNVKEITCTQKGKYGSTIIIIGDSTIRNTEKINEFFGENVFLDTGYQEDDFMDIDI